MINYDARSPHQRLFFVLAGSGAAFVSLVCYLLAVRWVGLSVHQIDPLKLGTVGVVTFTLFYQFEQLLSTRTFGFMLLRAGICWMKVVMVLLLAYVLLPESNRSVMRQAMQAWAILGLPAQLLVTSLMRLSAEHVYGGSEHTRHAIFVSPGRQARLLNARLARSPTLGIGVLGYFGSPPASDDGMMRRLGGLEDVTEYLRTHTCNVVFIGTDLVGLPQLQQIMHRLSDSTAALYFIPESGARNPFQISIASIANIPVLALHETSILGMARVLKRAMDVVIASLMLLGLGLPMLVIAWAVRRGSPGPVLFKQIRYGQDGKPIAILKFRSMRLHAPEQGTIQQATRGDARITRLGSFLRRTSLDELPQLFNVLGGSMSLVGPRPHAAEHNEIYRQQIRGYMLRHSVKPGITGWAQVNGLRGETDTLEKMMRRVDHDRYYIKHWSLWLDVTILLRTALVVFKDEKAY